MGSVGRTGTERKRVNVGGSRGTVSSFSNRRTSSGGGYARSASVQQQRASQNRPSRLTTQGRKRGGTK